MIDVLSFLFIEFLDLNLSVDLSLYQLLYLGLLSTDLSENVKVLQLHLLIVIHYLLCILLSLLVFTQLSQENLEVKLECLDLLTLICGLRYFSLLLQSKDLLLKLINLSLFIFHLSLEVDDFLILDKDLLRVKD